MTEESSNNFEIEPNQNLEIRSQIVQLRQRAYMQIFFGLLWWVGSAIAMYLALGATSNALYWYGGALGSLFHWHRAFKMIRITQKVGATKFLRKEVLLIGATVLIVVFSSSKILPEYFRVDAPTVGTCWSSVDSGENMSPVACWSGKAEVKVVAFSTSAESCPKKTTGYFEPSSYESRFTCLVDID